MPATPSRLDRHGSARPWTRGPLGLDRAIGAVLASAAGDALGSRYEFGPSLDDGVTPVFGVGHFGHAVGEWTDDTSMAMPILQALARGESLLDERVLGRLVGEWSEWSRTSKDVGIQTSSVIGLVGGDFTERGARAAARAVHEGSGRSGGNGSLMRTGPVALGFLGDGEQPALVEASRRIAHLTHWERDNGDACALWGLAIRHAVRRGELRMREQVVHLPAERRDRWAGLIDEALAPGAHPRDFAQGNGWVVRAFQAALAAVAGSTGLVDALERAVRGGADADTVAAIAGSLAGAIHGASAVPLAWQRVLHGWPGLRAADLVRLAALAARGGADDAAGWPRAAAMPLDGFERTPARPHPHDAGVWLGSQSALAELPAEVDAVVSLSRVGAREVPERCESVQVRLIDRDGANADVDGTLAQVVDLVAQLRAEGRVVFVHCAEARSRTAAVAALYAIRHRGVEPGEAWRDVARALPRFAPAPFLRESVERLAAADAAGAVSA